MIRLACRVPVRVALMETGFYSIFAVFAEAVAVFFVGVNYTT